MKLERAYSTQLRYEMTAIKADELYQKNLLHSKYDFQCPDDNCSAQIICANLDRPVDKRKVAPYYKVMEEHSSECLIGQAEEEKKKKQRGNPDKDAAYTPSVEYAIGAVRLNLTLPPVKNKTESTEDKGYSSANIGQSNQRNIKTEKESKERETHRRLSALIDEFRTGNVFDVQLPYGEVVSLPDLFVEIDGQNVSEFEDVYRVYHGKAWINDMSNGSYRVVFANELTVGELTSKPSFFINKRHIEEYPYQKYKSNELKKMEGKIPKDVYILSDVAPSPNPNKEYINFHLESLAFLDIR